MLYDKYNQITPSEFLFTCESNRSVEEKHKSISELYRKANVF